MIHFTDLDRAELAKIGIEFETQEEADQFISVVINDLELRIGEEIAKRLSNEQLREFDLIADEDMEELGEWLDRNVPDYRDVVLQISEQLERELIHFSNSISGSE
jgi:protein-tyrosine-phosphatase